MRLSDVQDPGSLGRSRSGRLLALIRRDMDLKQRLMDRRRRNEEVLALAYQDGTMLGGGNEIENLRENSLNLPYRFLRWLESQAISKKMVVKVSRDAGEGQAQGGPSDATTGSWVGTTLLRAAYEGGFEREIVNVIDEVIPRGTSVIQIGYHEVVLNQSDTLEVGKDAPTVGPEVLQTGDTEAKPGQEHAEIAQGLAQQADDPMLQMTVGSEGTDLLRARAASHIEADYKQETQDIPIEQTRPIRRKVWMRKQRVAEQVGWSPHVYDIADAGFWWVRNVMTVAEVKASTKFSPSFKAKVKGYDARNVSGVAQSGQTASTQSMGSDARQAQGADHLDDDERFVEFFECWIRKPDMKAGGLRKIVCAEVQDEFVEADENNPHVDKNGYGLIPGFFPFYDFTPIHPSLTVPERTCGVPPMSVGMPHFEKMAEYSRLQNESALRHSLRLYEIDPRYKDNKRLLQALQNGEDGYAFVGDMSQIDAQGKFHPAVTPVQFSGNTMEVEKQFAAEESKWIKVMGMPPAVLNGVGMADTATQDTQGIAAGERESGALVTYFEKRCADVLAGLRGLIRGNYDDEDYIRLLGEEGALCMKSWAQGTVDDGDSIEVTFGANAIAAEAVERKQLMEAINLEKAEIEPVTGLPKYDSTDLFNELHRRLGVGAPKPDQTVIRKLQEMVLAMNQQLQMLMGGPAPGNPTSAGGPPSGGPPHPTSSGGPPRAGPRPSEGEGPQSGPLAAGVARGTVGGNTAGIHSPGVPG